MYHLSITILALTFLFYPCTQKKMGYRQGEGIGKNSGGIIEPIKAYHLVMD